MEALAAYCRTQEITSLTERKKKHFIRRKDKKNKLYLSLSLGGPEELGNGGPVVSGLPTGKPAPKLVI